MTKPESLPPSEPLPQSNVVPRTARRRRLGARREAAKAETREALVEAARACFAEEGLDNPSLDAICARAGYTRGAFYVHFKDREELIEAVGERFLGELLQSVAQYDEAPDAVFRLVERLMGVISAPGPVAVHQFLHAAGRSPALRERYLSTLRSAAEHIGDAAQLSQAKASCRGDVDAQQLTWTLLALATGIQALAEVGAPVDARQSGQLLAYLLRR